MSYKVFLVEDEIVAREGIRDNVDWAALGFEFCGDASDGEVALPQIEATQPHVVITDIKMPFMDGLQLSKIIRSRLPTVKIIVLSGHDEFNYAQEAVKLGVTEYLLKPVGVKELHEVLQKVAEQLDHERHEKENLQNLKAQVEDNRAVLQEQFLLRLVTGSLSSAEAVEQSHRLEIDLLAPLYLVLVIKIELDDTAEQFNYHAYQEVRRLIAALLKNNPDLFLTKKDLEELVLIIKGSRSDTLTQEASFLTGLISHEVAQKTRCRLKISSGEIKSRLGEIQTSFTEAQVHLKATSLSQPVETTTQADLAINKAKTFINSNFNNPDLSLTDVADQVNLSSSHLSTLFSQETGHTFKEYLTGIRIDKAKELLTTTRLKSIEIAEQIGYHDPYYFSTVFKKSTGLSPREFRLHTKGKRGSKPTSGSRGAK
ncbi:MAG TPA: response regulator [Anaerolineae bacterium]|nr:response regulator [Anaerolineae bacterium]